MPMRQLLNQFGIFLFALALGLAAALLGFDYTDSTSKVSAIQSSTVLNDVPVGLEKSTKTFEERFTCNEASLQPFWPTLSKMIPFADHEWLFERANYAGNAESFDCSYFFRVKESRDLNSDGVSEVIVDGIMLPFCDNNVDCVHLVFRVDKEAPRLIAFNPFSINYAVSVNKSRGYSDLIFSTNGRSGESWRWVYKYNGVEYRLASSKKVITQDVRGGKIHEPPKLARIICYDNPPGQMEDLDCRD